jgi:hypothetical protein
VTPCVLNCVVNGCASPNSAGAVMSSNVMTAAAALVA